MKDIRFWRAEYPEDKIACDQTNTAAKTNALAVVEDETLIKAESYLLYFTFLFFLVRIKFVQRKPFLETNVTRVCVEAGLHACLSLTGAFPVCLWGVQVPQVLVLLLRGWRPCRLGDSPPPQSAGARPGECSEKEKKIRNLGCYNFCLLWRERKHFPRSSYIE